MKLSICIPTMYDSNYLSLCLESIIRYSNFKHEVCISCIYDDLNTIRLVNNFKTDALDIKMKLIPEDIFPGGVVAFNSTWEQATCEFLMLMHSDYILCPNWDIKIIPYLDKNSLISINSTEDHEKFGNYPEDFNFNFWESEYKKYLKNTYLEPNSFWPFFLYTDYMKEINGMDMTFNVGGLAEDDLYVRLYNKYKIRFLNYNNVIAYHFSGPTKKVRYFKNIKDAFEPVAHLIFEEKYHNSWDNLRKEYLYGDRITREKEI